jgi:GNAT superfamily N-acetyltransferase
MKHRSALNEISIRIAIDSDVPGISRLLSTFIGRRDVVYLVAATSTTELVGAAAISGDQKVEHLFVDPAYQGIGLGRRLWEHLRDHALRSGNPGLFKVNSSLNAVPIYERFGFIIAAPKVEQYGGAYVPMILKLAASN